VLFGGFGSQQQGSARPPGLLVDLGPHELDHARTVGIHATSVRNAALGGGLPLSALLFLMSSARAFVLVQTYNLDEFMLGVLTVVGQRVPVYVIAGGLDPRMEPEIDQAADEAFYLNVRVESRKHDPGEHNHVKLIVVDGLAEISGSVNLNHQAWRKAARQKEKVDLETDLLTIRQDAASYFSSQWVELDPVTAPTPTFSGGWSVLTPRHVGHPSYRPPVAESEGDR
jgi:hypothetical protein